MLSGKGMFLWMIEKCEGGDVHRIADLAHEAGLSHVLIKIADGTRTYNQSLAGPLANALRGVGVEPCGWQYVYGYSPIGEAIIAIQRCQELGIDHFIVNAEAEYKEPGKGQAAITYMDRLRSGLPQVAFGLSSYRYPSYHPQLPWREFRERIDFDMPQVYWVWATNAGAQLRRSHREFNAMQPQLAYIPTGAAFAEWGWRAKPVEIIDFLDTAQDLELPGANFWEWRHARSVVPELWPVIRDYSWPVIFDPEPEPVPIPPPQDRVVNLPEKGKSMKLIPDYLDEPIVGENVLQPWETAMGNGVKTITLNNLPPGAKGVLVRLAAKGTVAGAWVTLGSKAHGSARHRIDAHVPAGGDISKPIGPHDLDVAMCPLDGNKVYLSWDALDGQIRYYAELHGYGYEPEVGSSDLENEIELLKQKIDQLQTLTLKNENDISSLNNTAVKKNTSYKIV